MQRLFGTSNDNKAASIPSRLKFNDCFLDKAKVKEFKDKSIRLTEVKAENTIDRLTAEATPRQIERVVRGNIFNFEIFYDVLNSDEIEQDFANIQTAMKLLQNDYLGGHGARGSGLVKFNNVEVINLFGDCPPVKLEV